MRTILASSVVAVAIFLGLAAPVSAQEPSLSINFGYFALRGDQSRSDGDVLIANRFDNDLPLLFETSDFNGFSINGEWVFPIGEYFEAAAGIGFYQNTVHSIYANVTFPDQSEIEQDLKLRIVPISGTVRFLPLTNRSGVQPYVGAGIGIFNWQYSEVGNFVASDLSIFSDRFVDSGTAVGPLVVGGIRFPVGDVLSLGGELRYQNAEGDLSADFLGDKIDLGGWTYSAILAFRF
jgi:opacity protein-like surface antigen